MKSFKFHCGCKRLTNPQKYHHFLLELNTLKTEGSEEGNKKNRDALIATY